MRREEGYFSPNGMQQLREASAPLMAMVLADGHSSPRRSSAVDSSVRAAE